MTLATQGIFMLCQHYISRSTALTFIYCGQPRHEPSVSCLHKIGVNTGEGPRNVTQAHTHTRMHICSHTNMRLYLEGDQLQRMLGIPLKDVYF